MTVKNKKSSLRMYISFAATIFVTILVLKLVNWLPSVFFKEDIRKFRSLDEVKEKTKIARIYMPAYFPEYIQWPPSEIFAQRKPFLLIAMHFSHRDSQMLALSVYQVAKHAGYEPPLDVLYRRDERTVQINNKKGSLVLAVCGGNQRCNSLSWEEGDARIILVSDDMPDQLMKMAASMIHE